MLPWNGPAVKLYVTCTGSGQAVCCRREPKHLLSCSGEKRRIVDQLGPLIGMTCEEFEAVADEVGGGVVAAYEHEPSKTKELVFAQMVAVELGVQQCRQEVIFGVLTTLGVKVGENLVGAIGRTLGVGRVRVVHEVVGQFPTHRYDIVRQPDELTHHHRRQQRSVVSDHVG